MLVASLEQKRAISKCDLLLHYRLLEQKYWSVFGSLEQKRAKPNAFGTKTSSVVSLTLFPSDKTGFGLVSSTQSCQMVYFK
jgi:hypothetical protein